MSIKIAQKLSKTAVAVVATVTLSGCFTALTSKTTPVEPERDYSANQVEAPIALIPGDRFKFDNPEMTWEVLAAEKDKIFWENDSGAQQVTTLNPLLPALSWSSDAGTGKRLLSRMNGSFFPMEIGAQVQFKSTVSTDKPPYSWEFDWDCLVAGETRVNLPVGAFDTFRIECSRQQPEVWTFYYAPKLGYYVMMEQVGRSGGAPVRRILTGYDRDGVVVGSIEPREDVMMAKSDGDVKDHEMIASKDDETAPPPVVLDNPTQNEVVVVSDPAAVAPSTEVVEETMVEPEVVAVAPAPEAAPAVNNNDIMSLRPDDGVVTPAKEVKPSAKKNETIIMAPPAGYYVHVASYKNEGNVDSGWSIISSRHQSILGGFTPFKQVVDLEGKGTFTRLMAGPFNGQSQAKSTCNALKNNGQFCTVYQQKF